MKITKLNHACLLVEMPEPVNRTVLFDPGAMSEPLIDIGSFEYLDDIVITHMHPDHYHPDLLTRFVRKFPEVRILAPSDVVADLREKGITAVTEPPTGMELFDAPHESVEPLFPLPDEIGVHYLGTLSHPGDSHSFTETCKVLALPVAGPWASTIKAVNLAIELKPEVVIPIHDWHWSDEAREQMYELIEKALHEKDIQFIKAQSGEPFVLDI